MERLKNFPGDRLRWHASFGPEDGDLSAFINGFGDTPEEAIADGFAKKDRELERSIALVAGLKSAMYAEREGEK